jgi:hypothetical protein
VNPTKDDSNAPGKTVFHSLDSPLYEFSESAGNLTRCEPEPMTASNLLRLMRERIKYYGSPIPDGFVPPPGIDLAELLKQVPWPPAA